MSTRVELTQPQEQALSVLAQQQQCSLSELVKLAVSDYLNRHQPAQQQDAAFGLWRQKAEDGLSYQQRLRSEWADERAVSYQYLDRLSQWH